MLGVESYERSQSRAHSTARGANSLPTEGREEVCAAGARAPRAGDGYGAMWMTPVMPSCCWELPQEVFRQLKDRSAGPLAGIVTSIGSV